MGLFGNKKAKQDAGGGQFAPQIAIRPWSVPPTLRTYRLPAEHEATMYTYNGTPFVGLPANARFVVTAVPADVSMVSMYTGTESATGAHGDIAYEYNGQIIEGCAASP